MMVEIVEAGALTTKETCQSASGHAKCNPWTTYDRAKERNQAPLSLLEFLLRVRLEMERSLLSPLVRRRLNLNLELVHDLLHDITKSRRLAIPSGRGKVDRGESEGLGRLSVLDDGGLDARPTTTTGSTTPS